MRDVLFLSYFFPPMGGGAVLRALKFVKYLPAFGWRPLVVAGAGSYHVRDEGLLAEAAAPAEVVWPRAGAPVGGPPPPGSLSPAARAWRRLFTPWKKRFSFPDIYGAFARPAAAAARRLLAQNDVKLIFSTAPPYTSHVVATRLAADAGLPLVLDYRDAWSDNPFGPPPSRRYAARARRAEDEVLARAAAVIAVTEGMADAYRRRAAPRVPVVFVPNGYDEADFAAPPPDRSGPFTVAYAGQLYGPRVPWTFFAAASSFAREKGLAGEDLVVRFLGPIGPSVLTRSRTYGVKVEATGVLNHRDAVAAMCAADVNLLIIGPGPGAGATLTGKVFEYLRAGRPVFALVPPEGEAAALVRRYNAGLVVAPNDVAGAAAALAALYEERGRPPRPAPEGLARFERKNLTGELAALFNDVARK